MVRYFVEARENPVRTEETLWCCARIAFASSDDPSDLASFKARMATSGIHISLPRQMLQNDVAGCIGFGKHFERRAADLNRAATPDSSAPRRHVAGAPAKAGANRAPISDHERKALAACAPNFH